MKIPLHGDKADETIIIYRWRQYEDFLMTVDEQLRGFIGQWQRKGEEIAAGLDDDDLMYSFRTELGDEYEDFQEFNVIFKNSFFASCYFLFEQQLIEMCDRSKDIHKYAKSVGDGNTNPSLSKIKDYFKELGVNLPFGERDWLDIRRYNNIRNNIAHRNGFVPDDWEYLKYARKERIIGGTRVAPRLELNRQFCETAVHTFRSFILTTIKLDPRPTQQRADT